MIIDGKRCVCFFCLARNPGPVENYVYEEPYGEISINVYIETHPTNNEFKLTVTGTYRHHHPEGYRDVAIPVVFILIVYRFGPSVRGARVCICFLTKYARDDEPAQ